MGYDIMKNNNTKRLAVSLLLIFPLLVFGQKRVEAKADRLFQKRAYALAADEYEDLLKHNWNTAYAHKQLAFCYFETREFDKALPHLQEVLGNDDLPLRYIWEYALLLKAEGKIEESEKWLAYSKMIKLKNPLIPRLSQDSTWHPVALLERQEYKVEPVSFNSKYSDFGARIYNDTLYFTSSRKTPENNSNYSWYDEPYLDLYYIPLSSLDQTPKALEGGIRSKYHESSPTFFKDYKGKNSVFFTRNNLKSGQYVVGKKRINNLKIYKGEQKKNGTWDMSRDLAINSPDYSNAHPFLSPDGKRLYFSSNRPGGYGGSDIFYCEIRSRGGLSYPINAGPVVNTEGNEMYPFVDEEGQLYFASDGHPGYGQLDIFKTLNNPLGIPENVVNLGQPINGKGDDFGYFQVKGQYEGFFSSNRAGGKGSDDLYSFAYNPALIFKGEFLDRISKKAIKDVQIKLIDLSINETVKILVTSASGALTTEVKEDRLYALEISHPSFDTHLESFSTWDLSTRQTDLSKIVELNPLFDLKELSGFSPVYFNTGSFNLPGNARKELDKLVRLVRDRYTEMEIGIQVYTRERDNWESNKNLSEKRAAAVEWYLVSQGFPRQSIRYYQGNGQNYEWPCDSENQCWRLGQSKDQRVQIDLLQLESEDSSLNH